MRLADAKVGGVMSLRCRHHRLNRMGYKPVAPPLIRHESAGLRFVTGVESD